MAALATMAGRGGSHPPSRGMAAARLCRAEELIPKHRLPGMN